MRIIASLREEVQTSTAGLKVEGLVMVVQGLARVHVTKQVCHTGHEPQTCRTQAGLLLTRLSLASLTDAGIALLAGRRDARPRRGGDRSQLTLLTLTLTLTLTLPLPLPLALPLPLTLPLTLIKVRRVTKEQVSLGEHLHDQIAQLAELRCVT